MTSISNQTAERLKVELALLLLKRPCDALRIAGALRVPVPFGLAFVEELDEIAKSREGREANGIKPQSTE